MVVRSKQIYLSGSPFFGLTSDYRAALFRQIHEIVFHGNGGYDWHTVYNMPIWLRRFTFKEIYEFKNPPEAQSEGDILEKTKQNILSGQPTTVKVPDYVVKASKK
jgi:hypothetical protein